MTKVEIREAIATIDAELERLEQAHDHRFDALKSAPLDSWIALSEDESKIAAIGSSLMMRLYGRVRAEVCRT
jgi:hypothetical protein